MLYVMANLKVVEEANLRVWRGFDRRHKNSSILLGILALTTAQSKCDVVLRFAHVRVTMWELRKSLLAAHGKSQLIPRERIFERTNEQTFANCWRASFHVDVFVGIPQVRVHQRVVPNPQVLWSTFNTARC